MNKAVWWMIVVWVAFVLMSVIHPAMVDIDDKGLGGLIDFVLIFVAWHVAALILAIVLLILRLVRHDRITGWARWVAFVPIALSGGFALFASVRIAIG